MKELNMCRLLLIFAKYYYTIGPNHILRLESKLNINELPLKQLTITNSKLQIFKIK